MVAILEMIVEMSEMYLNSVFLLPQSQQYSLPLVLAIGGILGAILTGIINIYILKLKGDRTAQANRIKTYSQLTGKKKALQQTFLCCGDYAAVIEYNQALKSYLEENHKDDSLATKHIEKIEGLDPELRLLHDRAVTDLTKAKVCWWENVGLILALYNDRDLTQELIAAAKEIEKCEKKIEDFIERLADLNDQELPDITLEPTKTRFVIKCSWLKDTEKELHRLIDDDLEKSIDAFLNLIGRNLYNISLWERLSRYVRRSP